MTCFLNLYHSLTVLAVFILIFYVGVFLPDKSPVLRVILCLLCSFVTFGLLGSFFPDQTPTDPWVVTATTIVFMFFFWFVASSLVESFFLLAALMVAFPVAIAAQNSLADWVELETGWSIGKTGVLVLLLVVVLLVAAVAYKFKDVQFVQDLCRSLLFSMLAVLAIRFLAILGDEDNPSQFCCSSSETRTCPVALSAVYIILFVFLFLFRMVFTMYWREKSKQLKEECGCCCRWWRKRKLGKQKKQQEEEQQRLITPN